MRTFYFLTNRAGGGAYELAVVVGLFAEGVGAARQAALRHCDGHVLGYRPVSNNPSVLLLLSTNPQFSPSSFKAVELPQKDQYNKGTVRQVLDQNMIDEIAAGEAINRRRV